MNRNEAVLNLIVELRGGIPERCDFCGGPYIEARRPTPDEAGEWACIECWGRWEREQPPPLPSGDEKERQ